MQLTLKVWKESGNKVLFGGNWAYDSFFSGLTNTFVSIFLFLGEAQPFDTQECAMCSEITPNLGGSYGMIKDRTAWAREIA